MAGEIGGPETPLSNINVTPLVDVMLVLLIVFMITAPMLQQGLTVELPRSSSDQVEAPQQEPLVVSISKEGTLSFGEDQVTLEQLSDRLAQLPAPDQQTVFFKADRQVQYGSVVEAMDIAKTAGIGSLSLITLPAKESN